MLGSNRTIGFIPSKDLKQSRDFYENVIGLQFVNEDGFAAVLKAGDRMLRVVNVSQVPDFKAYPFTIFGWEVNDIGVTTSALCERGVVFERYPWMEQDELGVWTAPNGDQVAWFKDPDGNVLSISSHI